MEIWIASGWWLRPCHFASRQTNSNKISELLNLWCCHLQRDFDSLRGHSVTVRNSPPGSLSENDHHDRHGHRVLSSLTQNSPAKHQRRLRPARPEAFGACPWPKVFLNAKSFWNGSMIHYEDQWPDHQSILAHHASELGLFRKVMACVIVWFVESIWEGSDFNTVSAMNTFCRPNTSLIDFHMSACWICATHSSEISHCFIVFSCFLLNLCGQDTGFDASYGSVPIQNGRIWRIDAKNWLWLCMVYGCLRHATCYGQQIKRSFWIIPSSTVCLKNRTFWKWLISYVMY